MASDVLAAGQGNSQPGTSIPAQIDGLQQQIDSIESTPGPQGEQGEPGPTGPTGPAGDVTYVSVIAQPDGADGNHLPGITLYGVFDVCGASGEPFEAGVLDNPNTPERISAAVVGFQQLVPDIQVQVIRSDVGAQSSDVINADVEFYVRCVIFLDEILAMPIPLGPPKTVFVTRATFDGALGGIVGADAKCQAAADNAAVPPGTYLAWLSDNRTSPSTRFTRSIEPYVLTNGTVIANDGYTDLTDGRLDAPIDVDENGNFITSVPKQAWTYTQPNGESSISILNCSGWTDNSNTVGGKIGTTFSILGSWTEFEFGALGCNTQARLYCFQQ